MPFLRWLLRVVRILAGILVIPCGLIAAFGLVCAVVGVIMVFTRDESWSTAGVLAVVGVLAALVTWGLLAATTPGMREKLSGLLDVMEFLHAIGTGLGAIFRGIGLLFRVFD